MNSVDIINRLKQVVPKHTALFCDEINVNSLTYAGGVVTCTCSTKHNLIAGAEIFINGALTSITITSITRTGNLATATTASNHDLTRGYQPTITLTGVNQSDYNGTHTLVDVPNRRTFIFSVTGSPITPATGSMLMIEDMKAGYNGLHTVLNVVNEYVFTYVITSTPESPAIGDSIKLRKELSITGDVSMDRFLQSYSAQLPNKFWMVVILGGCSSSKDRTTQSDASNTATASSVDHRLRIIDPFSIFVVAPSANVLTAKDIRDGMGMIWNAINKSILFCRFPSGTASETNLTPSFIGHDMYAYDDKIAIYIHEFKYEFIYDLVNEDGAIIDSSVAFRDLDLHFNSYLNSKHNELMNTLVNLDDVPLP